MEKAFDTIRRDLVFQALRQIDLPPDVLHIIQTWLTPHKYHIPFKLFVGTGQFDQNNIWMVRFTVCVAAHCKTPKRPLKEFTSLDLSSSSCFLEVVDMGLIFLNLPCPVAELCQLIATKLKFTLFRYPILEIEFLL